MARLCITLRSWLFPSCVSFPFFCALSQTTEWRKVQTILARQKHPPPGSCLVPKLALSLFITTLAHFHAFQYWLHTTLSAPLLSHLALLISPLFTAHSLSQCSLAPMSLLICLPACVVESGRCVGPPKCRKCAICKQFYRHMAVIWQGLPHGG